MNRRIPLLAAVVGALLIGGATTGTTRASWVDQAPVQSSAVSSGAMGLSAAATPTTLTVERGSSVSTRVTVTDTSSANARNLTQRVTPTLTGSLPSGVTASLTTASAGGCNAAAQGAVNLAPGGSFTTCVTVTASAGTIARSATVTLSYSGAQVRGGTVAGWTTPAQTVSVPVTVTILPPVTSCESADDSTVVWPAVASATEYDVYSSSTQNGTYTRIGAVTAPRVTVGMNLFSTRWVKVTATVGGVETDMSNAVRLQRNIISYSCQAS